MTKEEVGKVALYKANSMSPIYAELSAISRKTEGAEHTISEKGTRPLHRRFYKLIFHCAGIKKKQYGQR